MIISRYLNKEVLTALLGVTFVLLIIFLSNQLVRYLGYAAAGKIAANVLFQLMAFEIPYLLALLLPLGLFLGIMLGYGRLYADSEMPVLNACGLGLRKIIFITLKLSALIAAIVLLLMLWINPLLAVKKSNLIAKGLSQDNLIDTLQPGRFQVSNDGRRVVYVGKISRNRQTAENLFVAEEEKKVAEDQEANPAWVVVSAASGYQMTDKSTKDRYIVSTDGFRYEGIPGLNNYTIIQFKKYALRLPTQTLQSHRLDEEAIPTHTLIKNYARPSAAAELQWRLSLPISVFILTFLAIAFSHIKPRQGRYTNLLPAMLIYIIYVNLLFVARNWLEQKFLPSYVGIWSVHLSLLCFAGILLFLQNKNPLQKIFSKRLG